MRKFLFLFMAIGLIGFSCTDELQTEIDDLKDKVDAIENAIVGMEFSGDDIVVTYGDGTTATVTAPDVITPNAVVDFQINTETNTITVEFTDGTTVEYVLYANAGSTYLSGTLSGEYGIESLTMGDVTLAEFAYDGTNRLITALLNLPNGNGDVINVGEFQNNYAAAEPTALAIVKSLYSGMDYYTEESYGYEYSYFPGDSGYSWVQEETESEMYTYHYSSYFDGMSYRYQSRKHCWFVPEEEHSYDEYPQYYRVPGEDSTFYRSYNSYTWITIDDVYGCLYYADNKIMIEEVYEAGEVMDTMKTILTVRNDDLIEKIEFWDDYDERVYEYIEMVYDANDLMTSINVFYTDYYADDAKKSVSGEPQEEPETYQIASIDMVYTDGLLTAMSYSRLDEDGEVDETFDIAELVYDEVGNPIEIWASEIDFGGEDYEFIVDDNGKIWIESLNDGEMKKFVKMEYNYMLPNFFGKTLEYFVPELKGLTIVNAPTRIVQSGYFNFVNMEYGDFNQGGYPAIVKADLNMMDFYGGPRKSVRAPYMPFPTSGEIMVEYTKFE